MFSKLKDRINKWMHPKEVCPSDKLFNLLFGEIDDLPTTEDLETACELEIAKRPVQVGVIRVGDVACDPEKLRMIINSCVSTSDSEEVLPVSDGCNQVVLLFFCDTLWEEQAREILSDAKKELLATWPDTRLCITLGTVEDYSDTGEPSWRKSYRIAIGLQDYRFVKPKGKVIAYSDIVSRRQSYPKGIRFRFDLLKEYLEVESPDLLHGWLSGIYSMLGEGMDTLGLRYNLTLEIVVNTVSLFRERGLSAEAYIDTPEMLIAEVLSINTAQGIQQWTEAFLEKCHHNLKQSQAENASG